MLKIAVTKDLEGRSGLLNIDFRDINFIETEPNSSSHVVVHAAGTKYYAFGAIKYYEAVLNATEGFNFFRVDKGIIINVDNIKRLDEKYQIAYFDRETSKSKCYYSNRKKDLLLGFIAQRGIDIEFC